MNYDEIKAFLKNLDNKIKEFLIKELSLKGCQHSFHFDCLRRHCAINIDDGNIPIKCPSFNTCQNGEIYQWELN